MCTEVVERWKRSRSEVKERWKGMKRRRWGSETIQSLDTRGIISHNL